MIEKGRLTMLEIEDLARLAYKFKVEFHVTIYPDSAEVELMPWSPTVMESKNTTKPVEEPKVIVGCGEVMTTEEIKAEAERIKREISNVRPIELKKE